MTRRLVVRPRAWRELAEAIDWYDGRRPGLEQNEISLNRFGLLGLPLIPAQAGIQGPIHGPESGPWVPAFAGTSGEDYSTSSHLALGDAFLRSFQAAAAAIADNPSQYRMFGKSSRRAGLPGFPHGLIYEVSDTEIVILAGFHPSRNPAPWRD